MFIKGHWTKCNFTRTMCFRDVLDLRAGVGKGGEQTFTTLEKIIKITESECHLEGGEEGSLEGTRNSKYIRLIYISHSIL